MALWIISVRSGELSEVARTNKSKAPSLSHKSRLCRTLKLGLATSLM
jgi:hypothetical protein